MDFSDKNDCFLTIEIGGTKLQLIAYTAEAQILKRWRFSIDKEKGADGIRAQIQACIVESGKEFNILQTGVGFGGPVNGTTGVIGKSHQISGWSGFPLSEWLRTLTGSAVHVENDANTAALGEAVYGAGQGLRTVFYVTIGSGLGGGLVQNGTLYHGRSQGETEIGHLRMDILGTTLEDQCAGWAVDATVRSAVAANPQSVLAALVETGEYGGEARFLSQALKEECEVAEGIAENLITRLSWGLSHVVHLFNPDILILGGGVSLIGEPLLTGIRNKLPSFVMGALHPVPDVQLAGLGEDVVPMGALALVLSK